MKIYTALLRADREPVLVKEGFAWGAAIFGPLWLAAHRAWIAAAISLAAYVIVAVLVPPPARGILLLAIAWLLGLTANDLLRWSLERRGYLMQHVLGARGAEEALGRLLAYRPDIAVRYRPDPGLMKIAVVDYGSGNLASASRALAVAAERAGLDATVAVTADPAVVQAADRIVLPGQGAFADCSAGLAAVPGMHDAIQLATDRGTPFLGICVGMQLMAERGLEHTVTPGFGWIRGDVAEMAAPGLRLPQMGWNGLMFEPGSHPLLDGLAPDDHVYFVHSYALTGGTPSETIATTDYGGIVPAIVVSRNRAGTQFHVEKSQDVGIRLLTNFLRWIP